VIVVARAATRSSGAASGEAENVRTAILARVQQGSEILTRLLRTRRLAGEEYPTLLWRRQPRWTCTPCSSTNRRACALEIPSGSPLRRWEASRR
jgi:hypothetical protein